MTILVDASALVALATREPEAHAFREQMDRDTSRLCCPTGVWEAARAVTRKRSVSTAEAAQAIDQLRSSSDLKMVVIGQAEARVAIEAYRRYGKDTGHPARLNMGDCFVYACAKTNKARLLYKGDDFLDTDLA